jgi:protein disulfide-isomerase-like protein
MKLIVAFTLFVCCFASCFAELVVLTDEDFEQKFAEKDWLVKFHAPWCKHCKTLKPVFEELAAKVSHAGIGELDATKHKIAAKKYNVSSYPTIIYKQDGIVGKYDGPRSMAGLTAFLDRLNAPSCVDISDISEVGEHSAFSDGVTFVLVHKKGDSAVNELKSKFQHAASKLKQHASFAILAVDSDDSELLATEPAVILKVEPGRAHVRLPNAMSATEGAIIGFVTHNNYPLVSKFDNHNFKRLSHIPGKYIVAAVVDYSHEAETKAILEALEHAISPPVLSAAGADAGARFIFGHLDGVKWRTFVKHHRTMLPAILVLDQANDVHQTFPLSVSAKDLPTLKEQVASVVLTMVESVDDKDRWVASETPGLFEKLVYRFKSYYPYSLLALVLPVLFFVFAMLTPYPQEKKAKQH